MKRIPDVGMFVRTKPAKDLWIPEGSPLSVPYPEISLPCFISSTEQVDGEWQYSLTLSPLANDAEMTAAKKFAEEHFGQTYGYAIHLGLWDKTQFVLASPYVSYNENKDLTWD